MLIKNQNKFTSFILSLPIFFGAYSGFTGLGFLGELSSELFTYIFLILLLPSFYLLLIHKALSVDIHIIKFFSIMFLCVLLSYLLNFEGIHSAEIRGRSGFNKFITSFIVFAYAFILTVYFYSVIGYFDQKRKQIHIFKIIWISFLFLIPFNLMEVLDWYIPNPLLIFLENNYFTNTYPETTGRLRGVSAEPSFYSNFLMFVLIIVLCFSKFLPLGRYGLFLVILCLFLTQSRTSYFSAFFIITGYILMKFQLTSLYKRYISFVVIILIVSLAYIYIYSNYLGWSFVDSNSTSNLSRVSSIYSALLIFRDNFFLGVGLGQYAFHAQDYLTYWSEESYEIIRWFYDDEYTWPPTFSLHSRLLAEVGVLGYLIFIGFFINFQNRINKYSSSNANQVIALRLLVIYCITISYSFDSFRNPYFWLAIAYVCFYLFKGKVK